MKQKARHVAIFDSECFPNYFLASFYFPHNGRFLDFEIFNDDRVNFSIEKVKKIINEFRVVTFNGHGYDRFMIEAAINIFSNAALKKLNDDIITNRKFSVWNWYFNQEWDRLNWEHLDVSKLTAQRQSLKTYAARMHTKNLLEFYKGFEETVVDSEKQPIIDYCHNDCLETKKLYDLLQNGVELRERLGKEINQDLFTSNDAKIAERYFSAKLLEDYKINVKSLSKKFKAPNEYYYQKADCINFKTEKFQQLLDAYGKNALRMVNSVGKFGARKNYKILFNENDINHYIENEEVGQEAFEKWLDGHWSRRRNGKNFDDFIDNIGNSKFEVKTNVNKLKFGLGGVHSTEKEISHFSDEDYQITDFDVTSYYPSLMVLFKYAPSYAGSAILDMIPKLQALRKVAKKNLKEATTQEDKIRYDKIQGTYKLILNSFFGKLNDVYATIYDPRAAFQVTITGQLCLAMLVERMELKNVDVISANTDGVTLRYKREDRGVVYSLIKKWERLTGLQMEDVDYKSIHYRGVNSYFAIKEEGGTKTIGDFKDQVTNKNIYQTPFCNISYQAIVKLVSEGVRIEDTINQCNDLRYFVMVRKAKGGVVFNGEKYGKIARYYWSKSSQNDIEGLVNDSEDEDYFKTSKVANGNRSELILSVSDWHSKTLLDDLDRTRYIDYAYELLHKLKISVD